MVAIPAEQAWSHSGSIDFYFQGPNQWKLLGRHWKPKTEKIEGTIIVVHGYSEHSNCYAHFAQFLNQKNFEVIAFDLPGHGLSEGRKANIDDFQDYIRSIETLLQQKEAQSCSGPHYLLGHSLGGLIATRFIQTSEMAKPFQKLLLSSPLFGITLFSPWNLPFLRLFLWLAPNFTIPNPVQYGKESLTHDAEISAMRNADPLRKSLTTLHWVREVVRAIRRAVADVSKIKIPFGLFQAGDDRIVIRSDSEFFYSLVRSPKEVHIYEDFFHEILNETNRSKVMEDMLLFIREENSLSQKI